MKQVTLFAYALLFASHIGTYAQEPGNMVAPTKCLQSALCEDNRDQRHAKKSKASAPKCVFKTRTRIRCRFTPDKGKMYCKKHESVG